MMVPYEGYSRSTSCILNLISVFYHMYSGPGWLNELGSWIT